MAKSPIATSMRGAALILADGTAELIASYAEAVGTLGAVGVALFLQVYLVRKRRPRLVTSFSNEIDGGDVGLLMREYDGGMEVYIRIKVWALKGRNSAKSTRVALLSVTRPPESDRPTLRVPDGLFKWSGSSFSESVDIAPGTWRRLDVLRYTQLAEDDRPILAPALNRPANTTEWPPSARARFEAEGEYSIDLVVSCDDSEPTFWRLKFRHAIPVQESTRAEDPSDLAARIQSVALSRLPEYRMPADG